MIGDVERVAVVGPGGAGKSTFAKELGRRTGLPVIHLDEHFWKPGWVESPRAEWRRLQSELMAGPGWVVDGNYGGTFDVRFELADTVIVLAPPRIACITGALRRQIQNHGAAVQAAGCPEQFDLAFLRWIWRYPVDSRPRLDAALARHAQGLRIIELRSREEAREFLGRARTAGR